jgi:putative phosphoesterase
MKIGLLSDTHSYLDPKIQEYFKACDEIWHAGDIGDPSVVDALEKFKPVRAVYGNIDDLEMQARYPEDLWFTCEEITIWMTHIGGAPPNYNPRIKKILKSKVPDIFICEGSRHGNMLYLNQSHPILCGSSNGKERSQDILENSLCLCR